MQICKSSDCTGCFACVNKCPKGCITMQEDVIGHIYPTIDDDVCINCGACVRVCPANSPVTFNTPSNTYAAYALDEDERRTSSSGGAAAEFSKAVILNGGVVYGCSSVFENELHHIRVETLEELTHLKGSKYVQSHINDAYKRVEEDLCADRVVLFIGTPCQVAGLKNFLCKEFLHLITVDLICHGVPSQRLLTDHLNVHTKPPFLVKFRDESGYALNVFNLKDFRKLYSMPHTKDLYFTGFCKNLFFRDSCYTCKYAKGERCSDITLGDFWGLGKAEPFNGTKKNGVSAILINTEKGGEFLQRLSSKLFLEERTLKEAINGNSQLKRPVIAHKNHELFKVMYSKCGFKRAMYKTLGKEIFKYKILYYLQKNTFVIKIISKMLGR